MNPVEPESPAQSFNIPAPVSSAAITSDTSEIMSSNDENNAEKHDPKENRDKEEQKEKIKTEKKAAKKLIKELTICKIILEEMEVNANSK